MDEETKKGKVLVVDDDAGFCTFVQSILESAGYGVQTFESAESFLACEDLDRPCCLLLDVVLLGMNGLELQEGLLARGVILPVVLISGQSETNDIVRGMKNHASDFLEKPFAKKDLLRSVERALALDRLYARLTAREQFIVPYLVSGNSDESIAKKLGMTPERLGEHRENIQEKLEAKSFAGLVRFAEKLGIRVRE